MIDRYKYKSLTWIDVVSPTPEDIREIMEEAKIPPAFGNDLTAMVPHSTTTYQRGVLKVVLDFPIVRRTDIDHPHEIKFIVTKKHLITIRFEDIEAIHRFGKEFEVRCMLQSGKTTTTPRLFLALLDFIYDGLYLKLDYLEARLKDVEEGIFSEKEKEMVTEISEVSRRLIAFRQTLGSHENALGRLRTSAQSAFSGKYENQIDSLEHHYRNLTRRVFALVSTLDDLRETNMGLLTTKQNEVMKTFTILAFITFPLTLFTSMFGMNTQTTPIIGNKGDFWIILSIMIFVSIFFFIYFKYRKWI